MKKVFYRIALSLLFNYVNLTTYKRWEVKAGFITSEGAPLECYKCGSKDLADGKQWTEEGIGVVEYTVICKHCGADVGHWSYGGWCA